MSASHIFRISKLIGNGKVLIAAKHNKREIQTELGVDGNIDAKRTYLNYSLSGYASAKNVADQAKDLMLSAGYKKLRKDAVLAIELIFSLPPAKRNSDTKSFFVDCLDWVKNHFGGVVLSFDVHLDEVMPHAHALILPMVNERMQGSDMVGYKPRLRALQDSFYEHVACIHGLSKPSRKLSGNQKLIIEQSVLNYLKNDPVMRSQAWPRIRDDIGSNPQLYAETLGITLPQAQIKKDRDYISIFISKGKGNCSNPIGFQP